MPPGLEFWLRHARSARRSTTCTMDVCDCGQLYPDHVEHCAQCRRSRACGHRRSQTGTAALFPARSGERAHCCICGSGLCDSYSKRSFRGGVAYRVSHPVSGSAGPGSYAALVLRCFQPALDCRLVCIHSVSSTRPTASVFCRVVHRHRRDTEWRCSSDDGNCIWRLLPGTDNVALYRTCGCVSLATIAKGHIGSDPACMKGCSCISADRASHDGRAAAVSREHP